MAGCRKPCKQCPFTRTNELGPTCGGAFDSEQVLGQAHGPFWLPCHKDAKYQGKQSNPEMVSQCAGAAIFRANQHLPYPLPPQLLALSEDTTTVFATPAEFLAYHDEVPLVMAETQMQRRPVMQLLMEELRNQQNQQLTHRKLAA